MFKQLKHGTGEVNDADHVDGGLRIGTHGTRMNYGKELR